MHHYYPNATVSLICRELVDIGVYEVCVFDVPLS